MMMHRSFRYRTLIFIARDIATLECSQAECGSSTVVNTPSTRSLLTADSLLSAAILGRAATMFQHARVRPPMGASLTKIALVSAFRLMRDTYSTSVA